MKTTLLLLLLITFSAYGQNETAFTLAKKLAKFEFKAKPTPEEREEASKLLGQLLYYTQCDKYDDGTDVALEPYTTLNNSYSNLKKVYFYLDTPQLIELITSSKIKAVKNAIKSDTKSKSKADVAPLDTLEIYSNEYAENDQKILDNNNELKTIEKDWTKLSTKKDTDFIVASQMNSKRAKTYPGFFASSDSLEAGLIREKLEELEKTIFLENEELKKKQNDLLFGADKQVRNLSPETCKLLFGREIKPGSKEFSYQTLNKEIQNDLNQNPPVQINIPGSGTTTGSISFKMPSESEMIEAAAAYLAKRVKQESVLWFFDEMRKNSEADSLLSLAFPETIKLLQSEEIYRTPNLSVTWRSALSKDFIKMPKNLLASDWLKRKLPAGNELACVYLSTGWEIAQYVDQKFNYREIIRQLYLNKNDSLNDTTRITPNTLVDILYAFSTELYVEDNKVIRTISYEELRSLTVKEMDIMLSLLDMKYNSSIRTICNSKMFNGKNPLTRDNANKISAWIGRFTFALNQFDKVLEEVAQKEKDKENSSFSYYNVWNLMSQALMELLPKEAIDKDKKYFEKTQFYIVLLNDSYEVYDRLSKRNYAGSVSKIMNIVDDLLYKDSVKFIYPKVISSDIVFHKEEFRINVGTFKLSKTTLASHLASRGISSRKVYRALIDLDDSITYKTIPILKPNGSYCFNSTSLASIDGKTEKLKDIMTGIKAELPSEIKMLVDKPSDWGGSKYELNKDSMILYFPVNSIGAMILTSQHRKSLQMIRKLASFLNDVALSTNEEMLVKVVESYALPPGSYKQKRNSWCSVDLNAFVGAYAGYETASKSQLRTLPDSIKNELKSGLVYGISAPIGVSFTKTFGKRLFGTSEITATQRNNPDLVKIGKSKIKSLSGFSFTTTVTILDLGAIVSYRFTNTDSVAQQSFKWSQFVSPGLHFAISIRNTPLVVMTGIQYTPQLRRVKPITENPLNMTRLYAGIYFDLPLYNMYTKRRVYKL